MNTIPNSSTVSKVEYSLTIQGKGLRAIFKAPE